MIAPQQTEYGVKVALLASLTVSCALVPLVERAALRLQGDGALRPVRPAAPAALHRLSVLAVAVVAVATVLATLSLAGDEDLVLLERGLSESPNPQ